MPASQELWREVTELFEAGLLLSTVDAKQLQTIVEQNLSSRGSALILSLVRRAH